MDSLFSQAGVRSAAMKLLVIGAGPAGLAVARVCADAGCQVQVIERRDHIAGNCFDERDEHGVLVHRYGPHYFRTGSRDLAEWLTRFSEWIPGRYYVRADVDGRLVPMPVSLSTMTALTGRIFSKRDFEEYLDEYRVPFGEPRNAEEQCLALVGKELYELLFKNYTIKQWGIHPTELDASMTARIPLRFNWDERYVNEEFQIMPKQGFTALFERMADHPGIRIETDIELDRQLIESERRAFDAVIYTGPVDMLFDYEFGALGYRSLRFEWHHEKVPFVQPCVQINYPNEFAYTRTVEIKHVTGQEVGGTTICYEYPEAEGEPFYPLLTQENRERYRRYEKRVAQERTKEHPIHLVGRLAEFRYLNTDQVLLRAIDLAREILENR